MMKKLVMLALVCGIASLATAGFSLVSSNPTTGAVNGFSNTMGGGVYLASSNGTINVNIPWTGNNNTIVDVTADLGAMLGGMLGKTIDAVLLVNFSDSTGKLPNGDGLALLTIKTGGPVDVFAFDAADASAAGMVTLVPEPATMVLLGLGALVLRRKK